MNFREYIPESFLNYVRLIRNKKRYPKCEIYSHLIPQSVKLGDKVIIGNNVMLGQDVNIGDRTYIQDNTMIVSANIGRFCSISFDCKIGLWEHPTNFISTSPKTYSAYNIWGFENLWAHSTPPTIGNDVWIGANVVIPRNVTIGDGAIIGAGAIVTKDIAPYAIAVGVPARVIKYRFDKETIDALKNFNWSNLTESELMKYRDIFELGEDAPQKVLELFHN